MSVPYQETVAGESVVRHPPGERHERICQRLHSLIQASLDGIRSSCLLDPRAPVVIDGGLILCPDLALVTRGNGKLWLAAEVIDGYDHHADTVVKKQIYEDLRVPRLWMIDPRYDNVEVYHASPYGLTLKSMLAGRDLLTEPLLPEFQVIVRSLFED